MKGLNAIENSNDPGKDGIAPSTGTNPNRLFGKDLAAFSLSYFNGDYVPINASAPIASVDNTSHAALNSGQLFNGNIRYMQTRLTHPNTRAAMPMLNAYQYDQLNRLSESRSYESGLSSNIWNPATYGNEYYNAFTFDAMGNILTQDRHLQNGTQIEKMVYHYQYEDPTNQQRLMRNRLFHINDEIAANVDDADIDDMGTFDADVEDINLNNNYSYDEEGRLVRDNQEGISKIVWRVDGKVKEIQRVAGDKKWLRFDYDAMGHRIAKHVYDNKGTTLEKSTYYILDAQGNQVSMYEHLVTVETAKYNLVENNIFGSSRIGNLNREMDVLNTSISLGGTHVLGRKFYEITNHLGNVLTVFTDLKIPQDTDNNNLVDNYLVGIVRSVDYSPFGVELDGRTINYTPPTVSNGTPTVIYQHKFDDSPSTHPYTGSPTSIDPNLTQVNWTNSRNAWTNFAGHTGRAIAINSTSQDTTRLYLNMSVNSGYLLDVTSYSFRHRSSPTGYANYNIYINNIFVGSGAIWITSGTTLQTTGTVNVANAIAGISGTVTVRLDLFNRVGPGTQGTFRMDDFILNGFTQSTENAEIVGLRGYRYGFQNQEKDDEIKGNGNSVNYKFRMVDTRLGRFFSIDPLTKDYPWYTPYQFSGNKVIAYRELEGLEEVTTQGYSAQYYAEHPSRWRSGDRSAISMTFGRKEVGALGMRNNTFWAATVHNTYKMNHWAYKSISERRDYYNTVQNVLNAKGIKSKWFEAAGIVTQVNAVGASEQTGSGLVLSDATQDFLAKGNKYLFYGNMKNAKDLFEGKISKAGGLSMKDPLGNPIKFENLSGEALDLEMVRYEQTKVEQYIDNYIKSNPKADFGAINDEINNSFGLPAAPQAVRDVIKSEFKDKNIEFDFSNYNHRVTLGQTMIKNMYKKEKAD